jgi:predicted DsbA family dithiol-disulfide isomerase
MKERLLRAYFVDGLDIGDPDTLAECAAELGFDREDVIAFLESDRGRGEVASYLQQAGDHGISAVPTFVVNGQWAIPGAQDTDTFVNVFRRLSDKLAAEATTEADEVKEDTEATEPAPTCADDVCEV